MIVELLTLPICIAPELNDKSSLGQSINRQQLTNLEVE